MIQLNPDCVRFGRKEPPVKGTDKKQKLMRFATAFVVVFLLAFMLLMFGPAEIYFGNLNEFEFLFVHFFPWLTGLAVLISALVSLLLCFVPETVRRVVLSLVAGVSLAGYLQVMFLNGQLDLLGVNPDGYETRGGAAGVRDLLVWIVVIAAILALAFLKKDVWGKVVTGLSAFLLTIQAVALVSLLLTAEQKAFRYPETNWHLTGKDQFTVSADQNVIVLILDYFSNDYVEPMLEAYPDALDCLRDFTYYDNTDCVYFGTFPSLTHMMTGVLPEPELLINDWCEKAWTNETTSDYFEQLHAAGYVTGFYTTDKNLLLGMNDVSMLEGRFDNITNDAENVDVFYRLLLRTMTRMSCYRMAPEVCKPPFYANLEEWYDIVRRTDDPIAHHNYEFYDGLKGKGLTLDGENKRLMVQHLIGAHLYLNDETAAYKEDASLAETCRGCLYLVEEFLAQLKALGVYDKATVIITSDHGGGRDSQVIFFVKEPGETHDAVQTDHSPLTHHELMPTIADSCGLDATPYGETIRDYSGVTDRERTVYVRWYDGAYPEVKKYYGGDGYGAENVYYGFTYRGDRQELYKVFDRGPTVIVPMTDSYF